MTNVLRQGMHKEQVARSIVATLVSEGIDENFARQRVREVHDYCTADLDAIPGCKAVFNKENWTIDIYKGEDKVQTITELFAGELNHSISPTSILLSLIYDSGYSLEDLGIRPEAVPAN